MEEGSSSQSATSSSALERIARKQEEEEESSAARKTSLKTALEDTQTVCTACFNFFSDPVQLGCGHTFCRTCLEAYKQSVEQARSGKTKERKKEIPCPAAGCPCALPPQRFWKVDPKLQHECTELLRMDARLFDSAKTPSVREVVDAMAEDFNDVDLQKCTSRKLCSLLLMPDEKGVAAANEVDVQGVRAMVTSLLTHEGDWDVQRCNAMSLSLLSLGDKESKIVLAENGGLYALIAGLDTLRDDRLVARITTTALRELVCEDKEIVGSSRATLLRAMTDAMTLHLADEDVQENCCYAFAFITPSKPISSSEANDDGVKDKLTPDEAMIESVVNAMEEHPAKRSIQLAGSGLLGTVAAADWEENRNVCFEAGACEALAQTLQTHIHDAVVLNGVLFAIRMLCGHGEGWDKFRALDTPKYVEIARKKHKNDASLVDHADTILSTLSDAWFSESTVVFAVIFFFLIVATLWYSSYRDGW